MVLGCGYIGGQVARQGLARGMKVTVLTRNPDKAAKLRSEGLAVVEDDLAGNSWHVSMPSRVDFVLNSVSSGGGGVGGYRHSYVEGMRSILEWSQSCDVGTFVYTGSTSVYPQGEGTQVDETASIDPASERAALLIEAENLIQGAKNFSRWFILRLAGIYGPDRHHVLNQLREGGSLAGSGSHRLNLVHRDDACGAIWAAMGAPESVANEIFNVADDSPVTKSELIEWLAARLDLPVPQFDPAIPSVRCRDVPDRVILNGKLKRLLGWQPVFTDYRAGYEALLKTL